MPARHISADSSSRRVGERALTRARLARLREQILRRGYPVFERVGVHITPVHFYQPVPDTRELGPEVWRRRSELAGIDLRLQDQLALLDEVAESHQVGLSGAPRGDTPLKGVGDPVDDALLRHLVHRQRGRVVTLLGEPWPHLEASRALVRGLREGDILLVNTSHALHIASDVRSVLLDLLPRVAPGVLVRLEQVYLPTNYPRGLVMNEHRFWTGQYALQAFLHGNRSFEIVWTSHLMHLDHADRLVSAIDGYDPSRHSPASLWLRRVG